MQISSHRLTSEFIPLHRLSALIAIVRLIDNTLHPVCMELSATRRAIKEFPAIRIGFNRWRLGFKPFFKGRKAISRCLRGTIHLFAVKRQVCSTIFIAVCQSFHGVASLCSSVGRCVQQRQVLLYLSIRKLPKLPLRHVRNITSPEIQHPMAHSCTAPVSK